MPTATASAHRSISTPSLLLPYLGFHDHSSEEKKRKARGVGAISLIRQPFADWVASSNGRADDLCLGFNAAGGGESVPGPGAAAGGLWPSTTNRAASLGYGIPPPDMGMVGMRDVFVVAPAASFHHQHHPYHHDQLLADHGAAAVNSGGATTLGVGVIPLLATSPCLVEDGQTSAAHGRKLHHLWQSHHQMQPGEVSFLKRHHHHHGAAAAADVEDNSNNSGGGNVIFGGVCGGVGGMGLGVGGMTCQDCGNQAKKDCSHRRCRTCCKSRGFDCATHVKSTWVPAARRRERELAAAAVAGAAGSAGSTSSSKKPRLISSHVMTTASHTSTSNTTPPRSFDTGSSHQDASFRESLPGQVRTPAVFKCVRVTSIDDGEDQYAYQATVTIGGHVFKGYLYDYGVEGREDLPNISDLHLGGPSGRNCRSSPSFPAVEPAVVFASSAGGMIGGGTAFGNPLN